MAALSSLHTPSISLLYPTVLPALSEERSPSRSMDGRKRAPGFSFMECQQEDCPRDKWGTAFGSWESWGDGSIHAAVKDVGSLDVDGWPDVVGRTFWSDRRTEGKAEWDISAFGTAPTAREGGPVQENLG